MRTNQYVHMDMSDPSSGKGWVLSDVTEWRDSVQTSVNIRTVFRFMSGLGVGSTMTTG